MNYDQLIDAVKFFLFLVVPVIKEQFFVLFDVLDGNECNSRVAINFDVSGFAVRLVAVVDKAA